MQKDKHGGSRCDLRYIEQFIDAGEGTWKARYGPLKLKSHFQPIFSLAHQQIVGYEGLLRTYDADAAEIAPSRLFSRTQELFEDVFLDRMSRYLHTHNYSSKTNGQDWLFLNVSPRVVVGGKDYGAFFKELLSRTDIEPGRVVVEVVEQGIEDESVLAEAVEYYRGLGCLIAIDDFGKGHSNFSRIWQIQPEMVKLDQSFIRQAVVNTNARRVLKRLITLIHESGSLVVLEGVETEAEALLAIDSGTDLLQGYYFARPQPTLPGRDASASFSQLCNTYRQQTRLELERGYDLSQRYRHAMRACGKRLVSGVELATACEELSGLPYLKRCYLLDSEGWIQSSCTVAGEREGSESQFIPLRRHQKMVWSQWREFMQAARHGNEVYVGSPHLSIRDSVLSRTLYLSLIHEGVERVLGVEVDAIGYEHGETE
ncbi:MAG: EAL domain-containing protein [Gammaproteobacteria bacterium]|nr:EAL domain-containing protein [Gammaproteobacteria bacterium]